jgi:hypothetical protein
LALNDSFSSTPLTTTTPPVVVVAMPYQLKISSQPVSNSMRHGTYSPKLPGIYAYRFLCRIAVQRYLSLAHPISYMVEM